MTIASNLSFLQNSAGAITTGTVNAIGSPITFSVNNTEYNRIDTNGYSLFGYTTSQGAYKLQVNGTIYASGSIIGNITGNVTGTVTTSSNVAGGTAGQLVYQSAPGITGFAGPGTSGQLLVSAGASAPVYTNTASIYVNSARYSDNITAGTTGQLVYQNAANTTAFVGPGTSGQLLVSAGASAPVYTTTSSIQVGYSANILAGTTGQLVYQSAANTTGFVGPGTAGQFLQSAGAGAPTYVSTTTMYVQRAVQADSAVGASGSTTGALTAGTGLTSSGGTFNGSTNITFSLNTATLMASAVQVTSSLSAGTGLSGSAFNGSTAQTWTLNTATLMASSVNIAGGTTGQLVYQSAANTTGFVGPGTAGQFLQSSGAGAPTYVGTGTMYVQRAVLADSVTGSAGSSSQVQTQAQPANATYYAAFVSANNASATAMSVYTTGTFIINPATGQVGVNTTFLSTSSKLVVSGRIESITDPSGEGGQFVMRSPGYGYRWSIDNYYGAFRIIREDDVTEGSGAAIVTITSGTSNIMVVGGTTGYSGEKFAVNGGTYHNGITTMTNSLYVTSGTVAIGGTTTYSNAKLQLVNGDSNTGGGGLSQIAFQYNSGGGYTHYIQSRHDSAGTTDGNALVFNLQTGATAGASSAFGTGNTQSYFMGYLTHRWNTSATERLRLTANGGVSFGASGTAYGSSGQVLQSNGDAPPSWVAPSSLAAASATQVSTQAQTASANYYPVFVSANNASATAMSEYTTSSFYINPATGQHYISTPGSNALAINVNSGTDRYFLNCTGSVNSFSIYENSNTPYLNSYAGMSLRANQNGGSGGLINLTGGNVYVANSLGVGTNTPQYPLAVSGSIGLLNSGYNRLLATPSQWGYSSGYRTLILGSTSTSYNTEVSGSVTLSFGVDVSGNTSSSFTGDGRELLFRNLASFITPNSGNTGYLNLLTFNNGNVGVGTNSPSYRLTVAGANTTGTPLAQFNATGTGAFQRGVQLFNTALAAGESIMYSVGTADSSRQMGQMYYYYAGSNSTSNRLSFGLHSVDDVINILGSGNVSIGTTTDQGSKLGVSGEIRATSEITAYYSSDINLKENIRLIADPLRKLEQIRGVYFDWTDEHIKSRGGEDGYFVRKQDVGVIAQEVEAVLPEIVATQDNGTKAVRYEKLVPLLVEAIKEQQQTINDQNSRIEKLELLVKNLAGKYSE